MAAHVMGILNVTPDSFSDGGCFVDPDAAVAHAQTMRADGADIIDVGGESTRPGAAPVDLDTEMARVVPVIEALAPDGPVSVDTRHEPVARAAVAAGASIINDVSASLWNVAADLDVGWIAMHMQGQPTTMQADPHYDDVVGEVAAFLDDRARQAKDAGVAQIWIDPGFGFGKTLSHNVELLARLDHIIDLGWPVAIGTSRKSTLGTMIAQSDGADAAVEVDDRLVGSVVTEAIALAFGADLIRVHDVKAARQAATVVSGEPYLRSS